MNDPSSALPPVPLSEPELTKMFSCPHFNSSGGNDYIACADCGLIWDYRRDRAGDHRLAELCLATVRALQQRNQELQIRVAALDPITAVPQQAGSQVTAMRQERQ